MSTNIPIITPTKYIIDKIPDSNGNYVDIMSEDGSYNKWLIVDKANYNGNQFPTFEILRCDYIM